MTPEQDPNQKTEAAKAEQAKSRQEADALRRALETWLTTRYPDGQVRRPAVLCWPVPLRAVRHGKVQEIHPIVASNAPSLQRPHLVYGSVW